MKLKRRLLGPSRKMEGMAVSGHPLLPSDIRPKKCTIPTPPEPTSTGTCLPLAMFLCKIGNRPGCRLMRMPGML